MSYAPHSALIIAADRLNAASVRQLSVEMLAECRAHAQAAIVALDALTKGVACESQD